ncbi:MAG: hypothetical protein IKV32_03850 [Muribaculaceae bacterium]|nr:hypothetical protein [Muribaculaceae bacterium]
MKQSNKKTIGWFLFAIVTFWILGQYSISLGDDLGYMFADTSLHKGDGPMIENVKDCFTTQANHYITTNGRFLVHTATHYFTAIAGMNKFNIANAIMFGLLLLIVVRFIVPQRSARSGYVYLLTLFLLWTCVPAPGTVMLSLVAFAINYMWTAVVYLTFLLMLKKSTTIHASDMHRWRYYIFGCIGAIIVGSLQESYTLPISVALFIMAMFNLKKINALSITMIVSFFVGSAICVFAPGNWCHAAQGGGFTIESIMRKSEALLEGVSASAIVLLLILLVVLLLIKRKRAVSIIRDNAFYLIAIVVSLLLAVFTFTSVRQLFCPSIFSIIVLGRVITSWEQNRLFKVISTVVMACSLIAIFVAGFVLRKNTYEIHSKVMEQLGEKSKVIIADASNANYNSDSKIVRLLAEMYAPDPLANQSLHLLFDGYTKRGLSRMGWDNRKSNNIINAIPYPVKVIAEYLDSLQYAQTIVDPRGFEFKVVAIDDKYKLGRIEKTQDNYMPFQSSDSKTALPYETYSYRGYRYFILPTTVSDTIYLKKLVKKKA